MFRSTLLVLRKPLRQCVRDGQHKAIRLKDRSPAKVNKIRNIGILAHIDAGKTTTTERMLYYSGLIDSMGEVHHGNTVTDYMDQERNRGITITSAAITFNWQGNRINLVDTPGHIDFTMEVEQTLQVLDGAIVILDSSAGVEAQTLTVWRQADYYGIPRIIFLNKMDRKDADLDFCMGSIQSKLSGITPVSIQLPVKDKSGSLTGIIDLITMEELKWDKKSGLQEQGKEYSKQALDKVKDHFLWEVAMEARCSLVEKLADLDDALADKIISDGNLESIMPDVIISSLNRATISQKGVPVLCGSAYRNTGIQPLMDAVVKFLPSPSQCLLSEKGSVWKSFESNLCAKAFKIIHHNQKGALTFVRLYSGQLKKGQKVYNIRTQKSEQAGRLMIPYANDYVEIDEVDCGSIAVISGFKETVTGDMITSSSATARSAKSYLTHVSGMDGDKIEQVFGGGANIPEPVFFCSVEPASQAYQNSLECALSELMREDPSLRVSHNSETGQTVLGGMGELHLDIIKERILSDYKIDVDLGPLQIAYKEKIAGECKDSFNFSQTIGSSTHEVNLIISLRHCKNDKIEGENKGMLKSSVVPLVLDKSPDSAANIAAINLKQLQAIKRGVGYALSHGPKLGCPVANTEIILHWFEMKRGTSETVITSSTTQAVQKLLKMVGTVLMEPMMQLEVVLDSEDLLRVVVADLSRRRILQQEVEQRGNQVVLHVIAPLAELLGYSTDLRTLSSGTASFSMAFYNYQEMTENDESVAIRSITGFS